MTGFFVRVLRIFRRDLCDLPEFSEEEVAMILGCLFAAIMEAMSETIDEVCESGPR